MKETEYTKNIQAVDSMSDTALLITMLRAVTHGQKLKHMNWPEKLSRIKPSFLA